MTFQFYNEHHWGIRGLEFSLPSSLPLTAPPCMSVCALCPDMHYALASLFHALPPSRLTLPYRRHSNSLANTSAFISQCLMVSVAS